VKKLGASRIVAVTSSILIGILLAFLPISAYSLIPYLPNNNKTRDSIISNNSTPSSRTNPETENKVTKEPASALEKKATLSVPGLS
jgi:hypothetical protein